MPLIAETGGINAMVVDSTALPEQVVDAVVQSAFRSAGQRCSALRLLCVHEGIADGVIEMIRGAAAASWSSATRRCLATDVGPVIDAEAYDGICGGTSRGCAREAHARCVPRRRALPHGACRPRSRRMAFEVAAHRRRHAGDLRPRAARRALGGRRRRP